MTSALAPPPSRKPSRSLYKQRYGYTLRELAVYYSRSIPTVWGWIKRGWSPLASDEEPCSTDSDTSALRTASARQESDAATRSHNANTAES